MKDGETNTNVIFNTNFTGLHNAITHSNPQLALNIQRYINVTTKWVDDDTGQELAPSTIQMVRSGDTYQTVVKPADLNPNYHLERIEGEQYGIAGANKLTVTYHYKALTDDSLKEDSKPITRTINYVVDDGQAPAPDTVIQTVVLTRHGSKNLVTGEITWGQWSDDQWNEVLSKEVKGYHPNKKSVAQQNVTINTDDATVIVHYIKNPVETTTENKVVKRTIIYVVKDNGVKAPETVKQEFKFSREVFTDTVTHEITFGNWNLDHSSFDAVVSPALKGYTPDIESVDALTVTPDSKDIDVTVTYAKNPIKTSTEDKVVKRTINYVVKDNGVKAPETVKQEFKFSREVFTDTVTHEITFGNWNLDHSSFDAVVSPALKGYTPDIESVDALTISPDSKDTDVAVTYTKNPVETSTEDRVVKRTIIYVVKDNGVKAPETVKQEFKFSREVFTDTVTHEITFGNWNLDHSSFDAVVSPALKGYTPDIESVDALTISPDSKDTDVAVTYTKNPVETSTEDRVVKRTIHYVVEDNSVKAPDPVSQEFTFSREVFTDTVTHEITFGNWNLDHSSFDAVVSPALKGYTPDIESVDALTVTPDSKDIDVTVTYTKNPIKTSTEDKVVKRTIIYVVKDNGVKAPETVKQEFKFSREVFTDTVTHEITFGNWNLDHSSFDAVVSPALKGYTPDIESVDALTISPDSKDTDVAVTYTKTSTEDRVVKRTINYVVEDNNVKAPETVNQVFTFSREVFTDTVTHETTFGNWNFDHSSFDAVVSPALKGYTPDVKSVDALTISPDSKDTDVTVTYTKNPVETSTEDRVVKRTIHYVVEDNSVKAPEAVNQQFTFSREVFTDAVTGEITFGNWNFNHSSFESVVSPSLKGYTPDIKTVDTLTITPSDEDSTVTVTYTKNPVEVQPTPKPAEPVDSNKPSPTEPTNIVTKQVNPTSVTAKSQTPNQVVPSQQATTSKELPQTGEDHNSLTTIGLLMLSLATGLGLKKRKKD